MIARLTQTACADIERMYIKNHAKLRWYIGRRTSNRDAIDDMVAQVFLNAIEAIVNGKGPREHESGWLYRIAHNLLIDRYRLWDKRKESPIEDALHLEADSCDPFDSVALQEDCEKLQRALPQLTDEQQQVIVMRFGYEMGFDEIGQRIGRNRNAVKALQHRALVRANTILRGDTERITPTRKPNCVQDIADALREHGPMTVRQISEITGRGYVTVGAVMPRTPDVFVKVDQFEKKGNAVYVWDLVQS